MSAATAHSMRADLAPTDWPHLDPQEVRAIVQRWGLPEADVQVSWHSPRPLSAAAIVNLEGRKIFVKRHHRSVRTAPELQEEHRFIQHLQAHGAPVSGVLSAADGSTAVERGDWTYEIHGVGLGVDLYRDAVSWSPFASIDHAVAAGGTLGQLHLSSQGFDAPARSAALLVSNDQIVRSPEPLRAVDRLIAARPALQDYLRGKKWQDEVARAIAPFHDRFLDAISSRCGRTAIGTHRIFCGRTRARQPPCRRCWILA